MEMNDLWTKRMKERLGGYASHTPSQGWKKIESELPSDSSRSHTRLLRFAVIVVALLIALSAVAAALIYNIPGKDIQHNQQMIVEESPDDDEAEAGM